MATQSDIRSEITSRIIQSLKKNQRPWVCPWSLDPNSGYPCNVLSKRVYRGSINSMLLVLTALDRGYTSKWWGTLRQFNSLSGRIRKGEKGTKIIFWKKIEKDADPSTGERDHFFLMRQYTVFNLDQVDGDKLDHLRPQANLDDEPITFNYWSPAEDALAATNAKEVFGGDRAFYDPNDDTIHVPHRKRFPLQADWYATRFHEYLHFICDRRRLNLEPPNGADKKEAYAFEELVVEIGSCFLAHELNVPCSEDDLNHCKYISSWLSCLQNDSKWIFRASSAASRAVDYLLSYSRSGNTSAEAAEVVQA